MPSFTYKKTFYEYEIYPFLKGKNCFDPNEIVEIYNILNPQKYNFHAIIRHEDSNEKTETPYTFNVLMELLGYNIIPISIRINNKNEWKPCLPKIASLYDCYNPTEEIEHKVGQIPIYDTGALAILEEPLIENNLKCIGRSLFFLIVKPCVYSLPILEYHQVKPLDTLKFSETCQRYKTIKNENGFITCVSAIISVKAFLSKIIFIADKLDTYKTKEEAKKEGYSCQLL